MHQPLALVIPALLSTCCTAAPCSLCIVPSWNISLVDAYTLYYWCGGSGFGVSELRWLMDSDPGGCQLEATKFRLGDRSSSMDSWLSHLKSSGNGVCQLEASPGMSGQPEARPLQWGPGGENSLIKFCLASPRLGPPHPHAHNLDTLAMVKSGHLCAMSASQKTSATFYTCLRSTQIYRSDLNLQKNLSLRC